MFRVFLYFFFVKIFFVLCMSERDNIYKMFEFLFFMEKEYGSFVLVICIGFVMALAVLVKLVGSVDINSDWFWFLTGIGFGVEGIVSFRRQLKFDRKFKVVRR